MQVSYRKIIEAMKELSVAGLIWEKRCGRGTVKGGSAPFVGPKHEAAGGPPEPDVPDDMRSAESASLGKASSPEPPPAPTLEVPEQHFKKCKNDISRSAGMALSEVLKLHPSQKERSNTDLIHTEISPSVYRETD